MHICCHVCIFCVEKCNQEIEADEKAAREKRKRETEAADKRYNAIHKIAYRAAGPLSEENKRIIDGIWLEIHESNQDGITSWNYFDERSIIKLVEQQYKRWEDLSKTLQLSMLPRINDLSERVRIFSGLEESIQNSPQGARQLVGDPIQSLPYLFEKNMVTKEVALAAFHGTNVTRAQRDVMWDQYIPISLKGDNEILRASIERASMASCCCFLTEPTIWGKDYWGRKEERKISGSTWVWEVSCLQRILCCPCHSCNDYITIQRRKKEQSCLRASGIAEPLVMN